MSEMPESGKMHLIQSFAYWLVLHNVAELGLIWGSVVCGSALTAGIWIMFRIPVATSGALLAFPFFGGGFPHSTRRQKKVGTNLF